MYYARARILRQSMANKYRIIDRKVGDNHQSLAEKPMVYALSGQWPCGLSKLDAKQSSLRRVRSVLLAADSSSRAPTRARQRTRFILGWPW
jgi:hypothetical protein